MTDLDAQIAEAEAEYQRCWQEWHDAARRKHEADERRKELRSEKRSRERKASADEVMRRAAVIVEMQEAGRTDAAIARHFGVTANRIRYYVRQAQYYKRRALWMAEEAAKK